LELKVEGAPSLEGVVAIDGGRVDADNGCVAGPLKHPSRAAVDIMPAHPQRMFEQQLCAALVGVDEQLVVLVALGGLHEAFVEVPVQRVRSVATR
jgi:hypothetical protein